MSSQAWFKLLSLSQQSPNIMDCIVFSRFSFSEMWSIMHKVVGIIIISLRCLKSNRYSTAYIIIQVVVCICMQSAHHTRGKGYWDLQSIEVFDLAVRKTELAFAGVTGTYWPDWPHTEWLSSTSLCHLLPSIIMNQFFKNWLTF